VAPGAGVEYTVVGNQFLPWPQAGSNPPAIFDFNSFEYLQREDKRLQAGFMAHEKLNDHVQPYMEFFWMDDRSTAVVAPSGLFIGGDPFTADNNELINCSNPLLSAQQQSLLCTPAQIAADAANPGSRGNSASVSIGRRNLEGGGRTSFFEHNNVRADVGTKGDINDNWTYDLYASYYYVTTFQGNTDYLDYSKINDALQVTTDPATGAPVCISGGQCVPWNIFATDGVTQKAIDYLSTPGTAYGNNTEQIEHIDVTGELGQYGLRTPWANDGAAVNFGFEHRMDSVTFNPDGAETSGDLAGFSGALVNINESYRINEGFAELRLPIAHGEPGAYDLTTDVGYRYSNYNTTGSTNTYKFEVQYAPIRDARLRFSFDRAIRAPNLIELFLAPSYGQEDVDGYPRRVRAYGGDTGAVRGKPRNEQQQHYPMRLRAMRTGDPGKHSSEARDREHLVSRPQSDAHGAAQLQRHRGLLPHPAQGRDRELSLLGDSQRLPLPEQPALLQPDRAHAGGSADRRHGGRRWLHAADGFQPRRLGGFRVRRDDELSA